MQLTHVALQLTDVALPVTLEGIPFPRVIIVFEYYKGRRLRPKEVVYFGRLEPVDPPALVHHGGQGLVAYCSSILTEVSFLQLRFTEVGLCELRLCRLTEVGLLQLSALVILGPPAAAPQGRWGNYARNV